MPSPAPSSIRELPRLFHFLWPFVRPHWRLLAITVVSTACYSATSALRAILGGGVIDLIAKKRGQLGDADIAPLWDQAVFYSYFAGFIALGLGVFGFLKDYWQDAFVSRVVISIRERIMGHLLTLSLRFFHRQRLGDIYSRLTSDVHQANTALTYIFGDIVEDVFAILFLFAACIWASPLLSLSVLVIGPAFVLPVIRFGKRLRKRARKRQGLQADVVEASQQMLSGIRTVKAFDRADGEFTRYQARNASMYRETLKVIRLRTLSRATLETFNNGVMPLLLLGGMWLVFHDWLTAPALGTFLASLALMYVPARRMARAFGQMQEALAGLDRIEELLKTAPDLVDAPDAAPLGEPRGEVRLRGVTFAYRSEPVLKEVTAHALPGEVIALVGPSGAGKSTVVDLVARFYDPDAGVVEVDGMDVRRATRASLLSRIAIVTQEPFLFNDTVLENVRYGRPKASREEAEAACRAADIHDEIAALPQGYDTVVGDRGSTLSGGQRQRVTIARALLKDPRILLLDEATSALDSESERVVQEALERLMRGRTTFVVAHRLSTIAGATRIYVLDKGRVIEEGRHEELLARGGLYAKLWALQAGADLVRAAV